MIVKHNLLAMNAQRQFGINTKSTAKSTERLSSGYRINRAADDAAGLAISEKMRRQIRGLTQGVANTQDGISLCQVADGALSEVSDMLHRITELSVKSANGTNTDEDRQYIQDEVDEILAEIDRISETTTFNERPLFQGKDLVGTGTSMGTKPSTNGDFFKLFGSDISKTGYMEEPLTPDMVDDSTSTMSGGVGVNPYVSVHADLSKINDFQKLVGTTFFANCCTNCCPRTFTFTDSTGISKDGKNISIGVKKGDGSYYSDPAEFAQYMVNGFKNGSTGHVEFACKGSTLYMYDVDNNSWSDAQKQAAIFCDSEELFATEESGINGHKIWIQSGCEKDSGTYVIIYNMSTEILGINGLSVSSAAGAKQSIDTVKDALRQLMSDRSLIGAQQNRLEHIVANEENVVENTTAAESRIRDTDMAKEMVEYAKLNILLQAGQSMLAQANQSKQGILSLLG